VSKCVHFFFDGYCSTVQGLLDWFEVDLGFTELSFIQIDLCVLCVFVLYSRVSLSSCPFSDILHCLPRAVGVALESALNLVSPMSPCGTVYIRVYTYVHVCVCLNVYIHPHKQNQSIAIESACTVERWGAGVKIQKNVRGEVGGWGRVPFNEPYAPLLSIIYDGT